MTDREREDAKALDQFRHLYPGYAEPVEAMRPIWLASCRMDYGPGIVSALRAQIAAGSFHPDADHRPSAMSWLRSRRWVVHPVKNLAWGARKPSYKRSP